jgi:hypothetical protein
LVQLSSAGYSRLDGSLGARDKEGGQDPAQLSWPLLRRIPGDREKSRRTGAALGPTAPLIPDIFLVRDEVFGCSKMLSSPTTRGISVRLFSKATRHGGFIEPATQEQTGISSSGSSASSGAAARPCFGTRRLLGCLRLLDRPGATLLGMVQRRLWLPSQAHSESGARRSRTDRGSGQPVRATRRTEDGA